MTDSNRRVRSHFFEMLSCTNSTTCKNRLMVCFKRGKSMYVCIYYTLATRIKALKAE